MRRRLYFLLPDLLSTRRLVGDLLLARIESSHIHVLGSGNADLGDLPQANLLQKTDLIPAAQRGLLLGGALGVVAGVLLLAYPPAGVELELGFVLIATVVSAVLGAWFASLAGAALPNSRLARFREHIAEGQLLLMIDVSVGRALGLAEWVPREHPEAVFGGHEATVPAFP